MLHLGDALGYSQAKLGTAKEVELDDTTVILTDFRNRAKLNFTSHQIAQTIRHLAAELYKHRLHLPGDPHEDTVVTVFPQSCDSLFAVLAVTGLSWAAAPLSPDDKKEGYRHNYRVLRPTFVLLHENCVQACKAAVEAGIPIVTFQWQFEEGSAPRPKCSFVGRVPDDREVPEEFELPQSCLCPHEADVCLRYRKPGTDLIIPITHRNLVVSLANIQRCYGFQGVKDVEDVDGETIDVCYCVAPVYQIHGLLGSCLCMLSMQAGVIIDEFRTHTFWPTIAHNQITWTSLLPHMVFKLMSHSDINQHEVANCTSMRFIRVTSLHIDARLAQELENITHGIPVLCAYSSALASHQITSNGYPTFEDRLPGSVGVPTGCEVAILNEDHECVPRDVEGNIWIRGHNVIDAYEGESAYQVDSDNFLLHNIIEWSLAKPASFVSSAFDLGSGRHRFFSQPPTEPSTVAESVTIAVTPSLLTSDSSESSSPEPLEFTRMHSDKGGPKMIWRDNSAFALSPFTADSPSASSAEARSTPALTTGTTGTTSGDSDDYELIGLVTEGGSQIHKRSTDFFQYTTSQPGSRQSGDSQAMALQVPPAFRHDLFEKVRQPGLRGKKINRFASALSAYAEDFPMRDEQMLSPLPLIIRWVKTHDRGRIDSQGRLFITQQTSQIIRVGAHPVSRSKVERRLRKFEGVAEALAVGIPDQRTGQKIVAAIQVSAPLKVMDILSELSSKYAEYEVPSELLIFDVLPDEHNHVAREKFSRELYELYQSASHRH